MSAVASVRTPGVLPTAMPRWVQAGTSMLLNPTAKLLTTGMRLGVGASLRYLKKNRAVVSKLAAPGGYDPMDALIPLTDQFETLDIAALHVFTFNQVANTVAWQYAVGGGATFLDNPATGTTTSDTAGVNTHGLSI